MEIIKKSAAALMACLMLLFSAGLTANAGSPSGINYNYGDVNTDNDVNMRDVVLMQKHIAEVLADENKLADDQIVLSDLNSDGAINMEDVVLLQKYIVKLIEAFPAESIGDDYGDDIF